MPMLLTTRRQALGFGVAFLAAAAGAFPVYANDISADAKGFVDKLGRDCIAAISDQSIPEEARRAKFKELLLDGFDVPAIGRFVLGRYWRTATDEQKQEFLKLFEAMILTTYADRFRNYGGEIFKVNTARSEGDNHSIVQSQIIRPSGGEPIGIEWRVLKPKGSLKIVDVIVEGVSMSVTQQQEYASVIQRNGGSLDPFLADLRQRYGS